MKLSSNVSFRVDLRIVELLLIWYVIFGLFDVITTYWLILHYPAGISGETNPLGRSLWDNYGVAGLILGKALTFIPFAIIVVFLHAKMGNRKWFGEAIETILVGLIGYSLIVILNNCIAALLVSAYFEPSIIFSLGFLYFKLAILAFSIGSVFAGLHLTNRHKDTKQVVEAVVGVLVVIVPTISLQGVFQYLILNQPLLFVAYLLAVLSILGIAFYMVDHLTKGHPKNRDLHQVR